MPSYLITGASRGLGLAFVAELLKNKENTVIATARDTAGSSGLQELIVQNQGGRLKCLDLDVTSPESIHEAAKATDKLLPDGLDHFISNAGVFYNGLKTFDELDIEEFKNEVNFNIAAPVLLLRSFVPLVRKSQAKKILVLTSGLGSIERAQYLPNLANAYSVSKAALNMVIRKYSAVLKSDGITIALIHPGWVGSTDIGYRITSWVDKYAPDLENLSVEKSAAHCMQTLHGLTAEDNGKFFNHDGSTLPW